MSGMDNRTPDRASQSLGTGNELRTNLAAEKYGTPAVLAAWVTEPLPVVGWLVSGVARLVAPQHVKQYADLYAQVRELHENRGAPRP